MYLIECPFCALAHRGATWEEVDEIVMQCRERAPTHRLGLLKDFDGKTCPQSEREGGDSC